MVLQWNGHTVLHSCRVQDTVALSSGEAELKATCRGLSEALGIRAAMEFLNGHECALKHFTDSSAAFGILKRKGAGAVKHLTVRQLWTQEIFRIPQTTTHKIPRHDNPADALCSIASVDSRRRHLARMALIFNA